MSRQFAQTYELAPDGPPPWTWERYESFLQSSWGALLASEPTESEVHRFLESHPCMLPGGEGGTDSIGGHHGPVPNAVVSEPELPGLRRPRPDFLWLTFLSSEIRPVLIEIEDPSKRWFNGSGNQSADLTQALGQLYEWRAWLDSEANRLNFYERYEVDSYVRRHHVFKPVLALIYGRRSEFASDPDLSKKRGAARPADVEWSTFDRLAPLAAARRSVTCRVTVDGWTVTSVPPTFVLGPSSAHTIVRMTGWETAIAVNPLIGDDRKAFLTSRLDYWREWASQEKKGSYRPNDLE